MKRSIHIWPGMITALVLIMLFVGCSRKTLSYFFDGVPQAEDTAVFASNDSSVIVTDNLLAENRALPEKTRHYYHSPYHDKECSACHDQSAMGKYTLPQPDLCYQCHEDYTGMYSHLHVPVELGTCTDCHNPHYTDNKKLLKITGQALCFSCHDPDDDTWKEMHDGLGDTGCMECHDPHGSNEGGLLK